MWKNININKQKGGHIMRYTQIFKLREMLDKAKIPYEFDNIRDGYQIIIVKNGERLCDAVEDLFSHGSSKDLLEIMGALTSEEEMHDDVLGYLTAKEVFKRFKYCYHNNTSVYKK